MDEPAVTGGAARGGQGDAPLRLSILGSTGSVGKSTVDLVERSPDRYRVVALTANGAVEALARQAIALRAEVAAVADASKAAELRALLAGTATRVLAGPQGVVEAASLAADVTVAAIVGSAGLAPALAAVEASATVALANKECLVCAGPEFMRRAAVHGTRILPVDSEHNAIFQVLEEANRDAVAEVILTASGGPFRTLSREEMTRVRREDALRHPNWSMGAKITVDSATMMNKGLELIEAHHLFGFSPDQLSVLVHPQSVVHGLVRYRDGSLLAQMGSPDMRTPIAHCLAWPRRAAAPVEPLDLARLGTLTFEAADRVRFPCLALAEAALRRGPAATNVLNAANEIAVAAFLDGRIGYLAIADVVERTLSAGEAGGLLVDPAGLDDALDLDRAARQKAVEAVRMLAF